jgi:hypothetical protein
MELITKTSMTRFFICGERQGREEANLFMDLL